MTDKFEKGDLITYPFGFDTYTFYVWDVSETHYKLGKRTWCVSSAMWQPKDHVESTAGYIRHARVKWYWHLLPMRDIVCPYRGC